MSGTHGQIKGSELWLRCPHCGDSQSNPNKAHYSINLRTGLSYCYRCNEGRRLSGIQVLTLLDDYDLDPDSIDSFAQDLEELEPMELPVLEPGPASSRFSALTRGHLKTQAGKWDAFEMRATDGEVLGIHMRRPHEMMNLGDSGIGYVGEQLPHSTQESPLRVVEGPYDVLESMDVCMFGGLSPKKLKKLSCHFVLLCPDGDVWNKPTLRYGVIRAIEQLSGEIYFTGVEVIPDDLDPDECPVEERAFVPREDINKFIRKLEALNGHNRVQNFSNRRPRWSGKVLPD